MNRGSRSVYLDIDGVVVNTELMLGRMLGVTPGEIFDYDSWYTAFQFEDEESFVEAVNARLAAGFQFEPILREGVVEQVNLLNSIVDTKLISHCYKFRWEWLRYKIDVAEFLNLPLLVLKGVGLKADFVRPAGRDILIDDNPKEVDAWNRAGGLAFLLEAPYTEGGQTLSEIVKDVAVLVRRDRR